MIKGVCAKHGSKQILLLCLEDKCEKQRLCCPICVDEKHPRHDLVSIVRFLQMMECIQVNRKNNDKVAILKDLNQTKDSLLEVQFVHKQKLQAFKNKMIGLIGECEGKIQNYFAKLFYSFVPPDLPALTHSLQSHFSSESVTTILQHMKQISRLEMGSYAQTQSLLFVYRDAIQKKIHEASTVMQTTLTDLEKSIGAFSLAKPLQFRKEFSTVRKQSCLRVSDAMNSVERAIGNGGYPMCLLASPFNPIHNVVKFKIEEAGDGQHSICMGVCLGEVVRKGGYGNCNGTGKGVYAIDQNYPYNKDGTTLASWNHHDTNFNQSNVGNSDLVGWTFKVGDVISVELDYYNSNVVFTKNGNDGEDSEEEMEAYEMPVKLDAGPLYAFVSIQYAHGVISIA